MVHVQGKWAKGGTVWQNDSMTQWQNDKGTTWQKRQDKQNWSLNDSFYYWHWKRQGSEEIVYVQKKQHSPKTGIEPAKDFYEIS